MQSFEMGNKTFEGTKALVVGFSASFLTFLALNECRLCECVLGTICCKQ